MMDFGNRVEMRDGTTAKEKQWGWSKNWTSSCIKALSGSHKSGLELRWLFRIFWSRASALGLCKSAAECELADGGSPWVRLLHWTKEDPIDSVASSWAVGALTAGRRRARCWRVWATQQNTHWNPTKAVQGSTTGPGFLGSLVLLGKMSILKSLTPF